MVRIFFSADVHGSELVWRKWLNTTVQHKAEILLFCGDLTGKQVIPLVKKGDSLWIAHVVGRDWELHNEEEKKDMARRIREMGYYPVEMTLEEVKKYQGDPKKLEGLFREVMTARIREWLNMAVEKLPKDVEIVVMPGNDDELYIDPVIQEFAKEYENITYPLGKAVEFRHLPGFQMISMEYVNPTPWDTPREDSEKGLWKRLEKLRDQVIVSWGHVILNTHVPPYNTRLDLAPKLDKNLRPVTAMGSPVMVHVGSKSVRKFIEKYQPMIGLHGHIHESYASDKIKNTPVVNPGSEYMSGVLRGFIIDVSLDKGLERFWKIEG